MTCLTVCLLSASVLAISSGVDPGWGKIGLGGEPPFEVFFCLDQMSDDTDQH